MQVLGFILAFTFFALMFVTSLTATAQNDVTVSLTFWGQTSSIQLPASHTATLQYVGTNRPVGIWEGKISPVTVSADFPFDLYAEDTTGRQGIMYTDSDNRLIEALSMRLYNSVTMPSTNATIYDAPGNSLILLAGDPLRTYQGELDFRQPVYVGDQVGSYSTTIGLTVSGPTL